MSTACLVVAGEALIDLVTRDGQQYAAHVGGSPLNVAVGAARLGLDTALLARVSTDPLGDRISGHLKGSGVSDRLVRRTAQPSSLAMATVSRSRSPIWSRQAKMTCTGSTRIRMPDRSPAAGSRAAPLSS